MTGVQTCALPISSGYVAEGRASFYGTKFQGYDTASGEPYDMYKMSAAHRSLPLPTYARVTNLDNGRQVIVRINDRGPFHDDRLIDLSYAAAARASHPSGSRLVDFTSRSDRLERILVTPGSRRSSRSTNWL